MKIHGTIRCYDRPDLCSIFADEGQTADISCLDSPDQQNAYGFTIAKTVYTSTETSFIQGKELNIPSPLSLTLLDRRYQGWTNVDGTYVDGVYTEPRFYDPLWINYGVYKNSSDGSSWTLEGYRFREPMHPNVGKYYANMIVPDDPGTYRVEWLFKKDQYSDVTAVYQLFSVINWGNDPSSTLWWVNNNSSNSSTIGRYNEIFGEWIGTGWGVRWPQYLW